MIKKEELIEMRQILNKSHNKKSIDIMLEILKKIKSSEFGLTAEQYMNFMIEFSRLTRNTGDYIAEYCKYRINTLGSKHINYLNKVIQTITSEPRITYNTDRMRVNK